MKIKDNGLSILDEKSLITWHPPLIGRMTLSGCEIDRVYWYSLLSERKKKQVVCTFISCVYECRTPVLRYMQSYKEYI